MTKMLSRDLITGRLRNIDPQSPLRTMMEMALALLDVVALVPGEGDVVERVANALDGREDAVEGLWGQLRRVEAERDEARRQFAEQQEQFCTLAQQADEFQREAVRLEPLVEHLRAKGDALAAAAETYVFERDVTKLDAAIAEWRK